MKVQSLSLCFMLLTLSVSVLSQTATAPTTAPEAASCDNPFINRLKNSQDATISTIALSAPVDHTGDLCKAEWGTYQTCCDATKISSLVEKKMSAWKTKMEAFMAKIDKVEEPILKRIWEVRKRMEKIKTWLANSASDTSKVDATALTTAQYYANNSDDMLDFFDTEVYNKMKTEFKGKVKDCFAEVRDFRRGVFCSMCSGRAASFASTNKLRMSGNACVSIVKKCARPWRFMYQFMQSLRSIRLLSKVRDSSNLTGNDKVMVKENNAESTATKSKEVITNLRTAADTESESITLDDNTKNICQDLLVWDDHNNDLTGDDEVIEEAVAEEKKEVTRVNTLTDAQKAEIKTEAEAHKAKRKLAIEAKVQEAQIKINRLTARITSAKAQMQTSKIVIAEKKTMLTQKRQMLKTATANNKAGIETEIAGLVGEIKTESKKCDTAHKEVLGQIKEIVQICPEGKCESFKTQTAEYFQKHKENSAGIEEEEEKEVKVTTDKFLRELKVKQMAMEAKLGEIKTTMQEVIALKVAKEADPNNNNKAMAFEQKLGAMMILKNGLQTDKDATKTWVEGWYAKFGEIVNSEVQTKVQRFMTAAHKENAEGQALNHMTSSTGTNGTAGSSTGGSPTGGRILAGNSADSGVEVSSDPSQPSAAMPTSEDGAPQSTTALQVDTTTTPGDENTSSAKIYTSLIAFVCLIFALNQF